MIYLHFRMITFEYWMNGSECCCCNRLQFVDWIRNEPVVGTLLCCCCCCCCLCCCLESTNEAYLIFRGRWVGVPMCHIHLGVCEHFFVAGNNSIICGPHQCHPPHRCHCASFPATEQFRRIPQEKKRISRENQVFPKKSHQVETQGREWIPKKSRRIQLRCT